MGASEDVSRRARKSLAIKVFGTGLVLAFIGGLVGRAVATLPYPY